MWKNDILKTDLVYIWHTRSDESGKDFDLHYHNEEYEFFYLKEGNMEFRIGDRIFQLEPLSLLLVPPATVHGSKVLPSGPAHRVSIHFLPEMLDAPEQEIVSNLFYLEQNYYSPQDTCSSGIEWLVQSILECRSIPGNLQSIALRCRIVSLLVQICRLHPHSTFRTVPTDPRIQDILAYLNSHLTQSISLEKVSRKFNISKNHLNVVFKTEMGFTINQYIRMKRLALARQELASGITTEKAAFNAGFQNYSTFFRAYKAFFGDSPSVSVVGERQGMDSYRQKV